MAEPQRQLFPVAEPSNPDSVRAAVLVLHGGRARSLQPVRSRQLAVLRMVPFARRIAAAGQGRLAVLRLRFGVRGWNGEAMSPIADASWALAQLADRYPGRPIGLVGHSMGGRAALRAAGHERVRSVVGLAPWLPPGEPTGQLAGRHVLLVHGDQDRMTAAAGTNQYADQLSAAGIAASLVTVRGDGHAMLRRPKLWHSLAAGFLVGTLLPEERLPEVELAAAGLSAAARPTGPVSMAELIGGAARVSV
jgi:predicted esterase